MTEYDGSTTAIIITTANANTITRLTSIEEFWNQCFERCQNTKKGGDMPRTRPTWPLTNAWAVFMPQKGLVLHCQTYQDFSPESMQKK
jgi:hypothetical protein